MQSIGGLLNGQLDNLSQTKSSRGSNQSTSFPHDAQDKRQRERERDSTLAKEECEFCGRSLEYHETTLRNRTYRFKPKPCICSQAQAEYEASKRKNQELERDELERLRKEKIEALMRSSMIPARWETRTFEHFQVTDANRNAYEAALNFANTFAPDAGNGLLFTGSVGTGKTHLSAAIALKLLGEGKTVLYGTVTTLLSKLRSTYGNDKLDEREVLEKFIGCDLLIIDDLGKEKVTEWVDQTIFEIINTRYERNKCLVITTNLSLTDIQSKYENTGAALASRILEMCTGIRMDGTDRRKQVVKERMKCAQN